MTRRLELLQAAIVELTNTSGEAPDNADAGRLEKMRCAALGTLFELKQELQITDCPRAGYVYFLRGTGAFSNLVKIGHTKTLASRTALLGVLAPFDTEIFAAFFGEDRIELESYYHGVFKAKRTNGEWFHLSDEDFDRFWALYYEGVGDIVVPDFRNAEVSVQ
jgi:hypothetical protein